MWPLPWDVVTQGGAVALLAWVVVAIVLGRLIPRKTHEDRINDLKNSFGAAIRALEETVEEKDRQIAILLGRPREPS